MLHRAFTVYMYIVENVYLYTDYRRVGSFRVRRKYRDINLLLLLY